MLRAAFTNEPSADFSDPAVRDAMQAALEKIRGELGREYPLIVGGERRETGKWITSVNPGDLDQVVGKVAKASAEDALDAIAAAEDAFKTGGRSR